MTRPRPAARVAVAACLALLSACADAPEQERVAYELGRMAFVPSGRCVLAEGAVRTGGNDLRDVLQVSEPLLVDRFEATRADWLHHMGSAPKPHGLADPLATTPEDERDDGRWAWPAYCDLDQARAFAAARGMRLLTAGEWMFVAAGSGLQRYPWGTARRQSVANTLELGLLRPQAVGTFESGRSTSGCYDLLGNVMEWVEGSLPPSSGVDWIDARTPSAMGGSYLLRLSELWTASATGTAGRYGFACQPLSAGSRSVDLGVRCAVEAEPFLRAALPRLDADLETGQWLERLGESWGRVALPLLEGLAAQDGAEARAWALDRLIAGARR